MTLPAARILLVEDNLGDVRLFREMARDLGYASDAVTVAGCLAVALDRLAAAPYDVVFLDLHLPDGQGLSVLDSVLGSGRAVPVVVFTGHGDQRFGAQAVARGAHDYLVKGDVHADVLARVIRYAVSRHRAITAALEAGARAAAAEARVQAMEESRLALEREVAVRRAAQESLERSLARLQSMRRVDRAIIANRVAAPMLEVVLRECLALLHVDAASVLVADPATRSLRPAASDGVPILFPRHDRVPVDDLVLAAARRRGSVSVDLANPAAVRSGRAQRLRSAGFQSYRVVALEARGELVGALELASRSELPADPEWDDAVAALADQAVVAIDSAQLQARLVRASDDLVEAYDATLAGWSRALDLRDRETEGHSRRVTEATVALAHSLGFTEEELGHLRRGALLHDIGKMGVPDAILLKPGPLDDTEWLVMRRHTNFARELLSPIGFLRPALAVPVHHHERWDGGGYPDGLAGRAIPRAARIFAVVDVFDALTSDRPYRGAWSEARAVAHVRAECGHHFDPEVVGAFLRLRA